MVDCSTILQKTETESCWSDVPPEVWSLILSRLFFNDRHNFKLVCKSWYSILPVKPMLPPPVKSPDFGWPCLMYWRQGTTSWKVYHALHNEFYTLEFPELKDAQIYFSKSGWLLMAHERNLFFFNPFTKEKIELPPAANSFVWACFTSSPTSSDCYVFGLYLGSGFDEMDFGLIKVGDEDWKSEICQDGEQFFHISDCPPLFHGGMYYLMDYQSREIGTFDPRKDENRWTVFRVEEEELTDEEEEEAEIVEECDDEEELADEEEGDAEIVEEEVEEAREEEKHEEELTDEEEEDAEIVEECDEEEELADEEEDTEIVEEEVEEAGEEEEKNEEELTDEEEEDAEIVEEEAEEDGKEEEKHEILRRRPFSHESYMAEVDGEIWGLFVTNDDRRVSVKKLDLNEMRWRKLDSLGNKCLYVGQYGSFAETRVINGMANKIYFNKFYGKSGVMYCLTTGMYHSIAGDFASKGADGLRHVDYGFWIKN